MACTPTVDNMKIFCIYVRKIHGDYHLNTKHAVGIGWSNDKTFFFILLTTFGDRKKNERVFTPKFV